MTNEQIRIAVAEEMGFEHMPNAAGLMWNYKANKAVITPGSEVEKARIRMKMPCIAGEHTLPDYPNSLDACAEFEKTLADRREWIPYVKLLYQIENANSGEVLEDCVHDPVEVTAILLQSIPRVRCEAFLRIRNRWKD